MGTASIVAIVLFAASTVLAIIGFLLRYLLGQLERKIDRIDTKHANSIKEIKDDFKKEVKKRDEEYKNLDNKLNKFVTTSAFDKGIKELKKQLNTINNSVTGLSTKLPENYISKIDFNTEKVRLHTKIDKNAEQINKTSSRMSALNERTGVHKVVE